MNDDEVTRLMPVPRVVLTSQAKQPKAQHQPPKAPLVGRKDGGETFFGDTYVGAERWGGEPGQLPKASVPRRQRWGGRREVGSRRALALALGAVVGLVAGASWYLHGGARAAPAAAAAPNPAKIDAPSAPAPPRAPPVLQVLRFELDPREVAILGAAHDAVRRADCSAALEHYQRLVNLSLETESTADDRWVPYLEHVRARCTRAEDDALFEPELGEQP